MRQLNEGEKSFPKQHYKVNVRPANAANSRQNQLSWFSPPNEILYFPEIKKQENIS